MTNKQKLLATSATIACLLQVSVAMAQQDPGPRGGSPGAGSPVAGLDNQTQKLFATGLDQFSEVESVSGGLGPRFNADSCVACHSQPAAGGTSPATNPEIAAAHAAGATNTIPPFITANGPAREVRFPSDGGVHDLFTITGRSDAPGCVISQPDFTSEPIVFRIPTPVFGAGFIDNTSDENLIADAADPRRPTLGITGHFNHTGNDGTITRFGHKAQNPSLMVFSGEAYNVEMGITNELFQHEREQAPGCQFNLLPEDRLNTKNGQVADAITDVALFQIFMTLLEPPKPAAPTSSTTRGQQVFDNVGCTACHTPSHTTALSATAALSKAIYTPYSDFQVHAMGSLADGITQGQAAGDEFRSAPLWGIGQRLFFLHDGRTTDLLQAILAHASPGSEANAVINNFNALSTIDKQNLLNFLRSL
jgi:CxxC motif-containing protein (DUF1111 family)